MCTVQQRNCYTNRNEYFTIGVQYNKELLHKWKLVFYNMSTVQQRTVLQYMYSVTKLLFKKKIASQNEQCCTYIMKLYILYNIIITEFCQSLIHVQTSLLTVSECKEHMHDVRCLSVFSNTLGFVTILLFSKNFNKLAKQFKT